MNGRDIIDKLGELENKTYRIGISVQYRISNRGMRDARASAFYKLANVIRSHKIYFILKNEYSQHRKWYDDIYIEKFGQSWPTSMTVDGKN
jgi:hypothetical protein